VIVGLGGAGAAAPAPAAPAPDRPPGPALGRAADVSRLAPSHAAEGRPVRISGTVVYSDPEWSLLCVVDASGAVFVDPIGLEALPPLGARVEIEGKTGVIGDVPAVVSVKLEEGARGPLPAADTSFDRIRRRDPAVVWAEVQGIVRTATWMRGHLKLELEAGGRRVEALIDGERAGGERPLVGAVAVVTGVLERGRHGLHPPRLWVPSWSELGVREPPPPRDELPILPLADARRMAASDPPRRRVRVRGRLVERHSELDFTIEDDSGRIEVRGLTRAGLARGVGVEVLGFLELGRGGPRLVDVQEEIVEWPDPLEPPPPLAEAAPALRRLAEVRALSNEEARRGRRVDVTGVITLFDPEEGRLSVQDDTAAVHVSAVGVGRSLRAGQRVRLTGRTAPGAPAPVVVEPRVRILPGRGLPAAPTVTAARLATGQDDGRLVEIVGRVRHVQRQRRRAVLVFESEGRRFRAPIAEDPGGADLHRFVGATTRLRGVCVTVHDWHLRFDGVELHVPDLGAVRIENAPPPAPPLRSISDVLRPGPDAPLPPRVLVRGEVLLQSPRHGVFLRGATGTLEVDDWQSPPLHPGDRVEAVGFAAPGRRGPRLEDAQLRIVGRGPEPTPAALTIGRILGEGRSGELVRLNATLIDSVVTTAGATLLLQSGESVFEAVLERQSRERHFVDIQPGSLLEVTGVALTGTEAARGPSAAVFLRSAGDVRVLRDPPWWTAERARGVAVALLLAAGAGLLWAFTLRRQVRRQTAETQSRLIAVRDSEARYRGLFDAAGDGILILRGEAIVDCNDRALEIFGAERSELLGKTPWELSPPRQPDGSDSREAALGHLETGRVAERSRFEWRHRRLDGSELDAEIGLSPVELRGVAHVQAIVRDVTERKRTETELQRLATAVEHADEDIVITDPDARILYVNPAFERITGYSRADVLGRNPRLLQSGAHDEAFYRGLWQTLHEGKTWRGRFTNRRKDGALILQDSRISPIPDGAGGILGFVAVNRDVTREVETAKQVAEARKMDALGTLAGGIAHDFNNILFAILGYVELAQRSAEPDSKLAQRLGAIRAGATRAADLTRQILAFSRRDSHRFRPIDLRPVVDEVLQLLRASFPATIEIRQDLRAESAVMADPTQIHQVLMNLGANAGLAMEDHGGTFELTTEDVVLGDREMVRLPGLAPGQFVRLSVRDTGTGMTPAVLSRVFEPFFTTRARGEGTGMGLAVAHGIVLNHGGAITADSAPGAGSRFDVYLPALGLEAAPSPSPDEALPRGREHLLLVEDEDALRTMLAEMLEGLGYRVTRCAGGREALDQLGRAPARFDLMLSDLTMPDMTGDVLTHEALGIRGNLPVVLCTGFGEEWTAERARALGARGLLLKPITLRELARAVRAALDAPPRGA
jgi:PAS domain S-box-containing protein